MVCPSKEGSLKRLAERHGKVVSEMHTVKILVERNGLLLSLTTRSYSYLIFISRPLIGFRRVVTDERIVARAGYDIRRTLAIIDSHHDAGGT